jgi:hypothetical protein
MGPGLRAVCRIAALRVLSAYIPRTHGPKKATRSWPEPGLLPFGAMEHAWNMYGIYVYICIYVYIYIQIYMEYVWNMRGACRE